MEVKGPFSGQFSIENQREKEVPFRHRFLSIFMQKKYFFSRKNRQILTKSSLFEPSKSGRRAIYGPILGVFDPLFGQISIEN